MGLSPLIERLDRQGASQFAHWDPTLFRAYCQALLKDGSDTPAAAALAELVCEGVGRGYLAAGLHVNPTNLLEYCFRNWLPARLADVAPERRLPFLADTWNLLEGVLGEPRWVNAYVLARVRELHREPGLEAFLGRVLRPLLEPASRANWAGPFRVTTLSLRACDDEVLPGDMHLVAPTVLAVRDRRRDLVCGVVLRKEGRSEPAGVFGDTPPFVEPPPAAPPRWQGEWVAFGETRVRLPFLGEPFRWLQADAGYLVASAVNSQNLWIVESAT